MLAGWVHSPGGRPPAGSRARGRCAARARHQGQGQAASAAHRRQERRHEVGGAAVAERTEQRRHADEGMGDRAISVTQIEVTQSY